MFISRYKQWCMVLNLDWSNWYLIWIFDLKVFWEMIRVKRLINGLSSQLSSHSIQLRVNFQEVYSRFGEVVRKYILTVYISSKHISPFSPWHVHANMNFPYSPAFSCVTRCRTGIRSPRSTERRGDVYKYGRARSLPSNGSKWLCRWAANKSAVRKSGYALLCVRPPATYFWTTSARRWICPEKISEETRSISSQNYRQSSLFFFSFALKFFNWRIGVKSPLFVFAHEKTRLALYSFY